MRRRLRATRADPTDERVHAANRHTVAPPDLVESFVFRPKSPMPSPAVLAKVGSAYHAALPHVLDALHFLTSSSLGLPADYFEPYYSPHMPEMVSLRLLYYPPHRTRRNCRRRCATASTLTILASRSYTRTRTTRRTMSQPDMACRCSCRMGSGTLSPDTWCPFGEHW